MTILAATMRTPVTSANKAAKPISAPSFALENPRKMVTAVAVRANMMIF